MIIEEGKYYLYRWIRLDKNEPFYIGIGTKTKDDTKYGTYSRSYVEKKNNPIWEYIKNKTKYEIEILLESDNYEFILQKEVEFIKIYGRIDKKTGCLANLTDGGEGTKNVIVSEKARELRRVFHTGRKRSKESIEKRLRTIEQRGGRKLSKEAKKQIAISKSKPVLQFSIEGNLIREWSTVVTASEELNIPKYRITNCANIYNTFTYTGYNYIWVYKEDYEKGYLEKFNTAIGRAKKGNIKIFFTEEKRKEILFEYNNIIPIFAKKGERISHLAAKFKMNYSTVRAIIRKEENN